MITLLILSFLSLGSIGFIFYKYRNIEPAIAPAPIVVRDLLHPKIKDVIRPHATKARELASAGTLVAKKHFYSYILIAAQKVLPMIEKMSHNVESRLVRVLNAIRGKGSIPTNRGSASMFLQNISTRNFPKS